MNTTYSQPAPKGIRQVLENSRLFRGLSPDFIDAIASSATRKTLGNDEILFQKGDPADALWGVLSGRIVIEVSTDDGKEMVLDSFGEGEVFGEVGVLDFGPRRVEARAEEKSELFRLERKHFLKHLQASPELCFRVFSLLCSHLRETTENLEDTALQKLPNRLAKRLVLLAGNSRTGDGTVLKIVQSDLAGMLGVHRQAVNKHLREFEKDGLIILKRQSIEIADHQALIDIASPGQYGNQAAWGTENLSELEHKTFTFRQPNEDNSRSQEPHSAGLIAIDAAEYSHSLMTDAAGTLKRIEAGLLVVEQAIEKYEGHTVWHTGDRVLAEFPDAQQAMQVALDIQERVNPARHAGKGKRDSLFRIGVHYGKVLAGDHRIFGEAVNTVIRLTQLSAAGGIAISGAVRDALKNREQLHLQFLGDHELKNVPGTIPVYSARSIPLFKLLTLRAESLVPRRLRPVAVTLVAVLAIAGIWFGGEWMGSHSVPISVAPLSIAVLPFTTSDDPELDYLAEGIPQEVRASLSVIPGMQVIGRESSDYYKSRTVSTEEIGRTLGVAWLLQGNFQSTENGTQLTTRLTDTSSSEVVWEEQFGTFQENYAGFGLGIINGIARNLGLIDEQGGGLPGLLPLTNNSEAYALYLKAHHLMSNPSRSRYLEAYSLLQEAVELDALFAEAHAIISKFLLTGVLAQQDGLTQSVRNELAKQSLNKAISLKPDSPLVLAVASVARWFAKDYEGALTLAERAYKIDPNNREALYAQRMVKIIQQDRAGAFYISQRILELNPLSVQAMHDVQNGFKVRGQYQEALAIANRALALYPEDEAPIAHTWVADIKLETGDRVGAIVSYRKGEPATNPIDLWTGLDYSQEVLDEFKQWRSHATLVYLEEYDQVRKIIEHRYEDNEANAEWLSSKEYMVYRGELEALAGDYISAAEYFARAGIAELEPETDTNPASLRPWGRVVTMADARQSHFSLAMLLAYRQTGQHEKAEITAKKIEYIIVEHRKTLATVSDRAQFRFLYKEAQFHAIEGRTAQALETLRSWIDHGTIFTYISWDPYFDGLRGNSQFESIVAEVESKLADVRAQFHAQQASSK